MSSQFGHLPLSWPMTGGVSRSRSSSSIAPAAALGHSADLGTVTPGHSGLSTVTPGHEGLDRENQKKPRAEQIERVALSRLNLDQRQ